MFLAWHDHRRAQVEQAVRVRRCLLANLQHAWAVVVHHHRHCPTILWRRCECFRREGLRAWVPIIMLVLRVSEEVVYFQWHFNDFMWVRVFLRNWLSLHGTSWRPISMPFRCSKHGLMLFRSESRSRWGRAAGVSDRTCLSPEHALVNSYILIVSNRSLFVTAKSLRKRSSFIDFFTFLSDRCFQFIRWR